MKRAVFILASAMVLSAPASAQAPKAAAAVAPARTAVTTMAPGWTAAATPAPAPTASAAFGCDARAPNVCHFRIFYSRGDRIVILPSGMSAKVPGVTIGGNYCMTLGKNPVYKCPRKVINDKYNS